ncbi:MAG: hypothetical protein IPO09_04475 [Anaeromyxobacter sp.]|nr:hypothetical protein [Anaeromyxobacter sp.]
MGEGEQTNPTSTSPPNQPPSPTLTSTRPAPLALLLALALAAPAPAAAAPRQVAIFEDASNDATGPGGYTPPGDADYRDGDFDLRRLTVSVDGEDVLFEVTLGAPFRTPLTTTRSGSTPVQLLNGIALQNLDLYLDTDPTPGAGSSACIPGRRVAFAGGRTWEAAVVFTPQPGPARALTRDALGGAADRVVFVDGLQVLGRTVTARVPAALLGGPPRPDWGYSLHLSGAAWERTFALGSRLRGTRQPDAFTLPVLPVPEAWAFGGGAMGEVHPRVVDVLLPASADQRRILGSYDEASGAFARVPFLLAGSTPGGARLAPEVTATPTATATATPTPTSTRP